MPHSNFRLVGAVAVVLTSLCLQSGCSEKKTSVSGTVVLPPKIKLIDTDNVSVGFSPDGAETGGSSAHVSASDMTFTAKDITPGKYKITVKLNAYPGMPDSAKRASEFEAVNKSFDQKKTPLRYEVTSEAVQTIAIDLATKTVTKK